MATPSAPDKPMPNDPQQQQQGPDNVQDALTKLSASLGGDKSGPQQARLADVITRVADFLQLSPTEGRGGSLPLDFLLDVGVPVTVELGHANLPIGEVLKLGPDSVVELDREVTQPVDLVVCGVLLARGEVVVVEDRFAIRIKELLHPRARRGGGGG